MTTIKGKLYVHALLDASGSMLAAKGATIAAWNNYVDGLPDEAVVSLTTFSSRGIKHPRQNATKARAKYFADDYECRGDTPLRDAIGQAVQSIDTAAKEYDRVVFVIQTDGRDNFSREFSAEQIKQILTDKQEGEGWLVVFLGAGMEAYEQVGQLGFVEANAMNYSLGNSVSALASVSRATTSYTSSPTRAAGRLGAAFTEDERNRSR